MAFDFGNALGFLGGIFGSPGKPYDKASQQYNQWTDNAARTNAPFYNAGAGAIPAYQQWLQGQQNPSQFINNLMGGYSESPWAHNQQQQSMNAGMNLGSASGLTGSSALAQQLQQNASNISSEDMNKWLQNVLGINTQYGEGQKNLMGMGQNAANNLSTMYGNAANFNSENAYNKQATKDNNIWNTIASGLGIFGL
jgi:hypothetical protein